MYKDVVRLKKRILSLTLSICLVFGTASALPNNVFVDSTAVTASAETATGSLGENITYSLDDNGTLTISGNGDMTDYGFLENPEDLHSPLANNNSIKKVIVENGVTSIGEQVFTGCSNISSVSIPDGVTRIGYSAFYGCKSISVIILPKSVSDFDPFAFSGCNSLTTFNVDTNNANFTSIDGVLYNKNATELVRFPTGKTGYFAVPDTVTRIGMGAFNDCVLTNVILPDSLTSIGEFAFSFCKNIESVVIPKGVTAIDNCVFLSSGLTSVGIPEGVTSIGNQAFDNCKNLRSISVPNTVKNIGFSPFGFYQSDSGSYEKIDSFSVSCYAGSPAHLYAMNRELPCQLIGPSTGSLGDAVTYTLGTDGVLTVSGNGKMKDYTNLDSPFYNDNTYSVYGPNNSFIEEVVIEDGVTSIGNYAFYRCVGIENVNISGSVKSIGSNAFKECNGLVNINIPNGVTTIGSSAFIDCHNCFMITVPDSVSNIGEYALGYYDSNSFTHIPNFRILCNEGSTAEEYAIENGIDHQLPFSPTGSLGENITYNLDNNGTLTISGSGAMDNYGWGYSPLFCNSDIKHVIVKNGITSIGDSVFSNCTNLQSIQIPNSVTSIGYDALSNCDNLECIEVAGNNQYYSSLKGVLYNKDKTELLKCPQNIQSFDGIPKSVTIVGNYAFEKCKKLTSVIIPSTVTSVESYAFCECTNLQSVIISSNIGLCAFKSCTSLSSVTISDEVTNVEENAFYECPSLKSITIPGSVKYIGENAFGCLMVAYTNQDELIKIKVDGFTIYGVPGSAAETYATENGFKFVKLDVLNGWSILSTGKRMYYKNGIAVTGKQKIDNKWYYFNADGIMQTGWQKIDNKWYFFSTDGIMQTGWQKLSNTWYFFNTSGIMVTGWQKLSNIWYFFNTSGAMVTGWQKLGNTWYFFNTSGIMVTGWQKLSNTWYFFNTSGAMVNGWQKLSNIWYFFNSSGAMVTGWQKIGNTWYFFNTSGAMVTGWQKISNKWYYFDSSGAMLANTSRKIGGKTYKFNASGACTNP